MLGISRNQIKLLGNHIAAIDLERVSSNAEGIIFVCNKLSRKLIEKRNGIVFIPRGRETPC